MPRCCSSSIQSDVAERRPLAGLDRAGPAGERAAVEQELLGEGGLARVGVGDDGERPAALCLSGGVDQQAAGRPGRGHRGSRRTSSFRPMTLHGKGRGTARVPPSMTRATDSVRMVRGYRGWPANRRPMTGRHRRWIASLRNDTVMKLVFAAVDADGNRYASISPARWRAGSPLGARPTQSSVASVASELDRRRPGSRRDAARCRGSSSPAEAAPRAFGVPSVRLPRTGHDEPDRAADRVPGRGHRHLDRHLWRVP